MARVSKRISKKTKGKARKASQTKRPKVAKTNRRISPSAMLRKRHSTSGRHDPLYDHFNELKEAREQQAASAEILRVINSSKGDLAPVFDIILEKAHGLCDVTSGSLQLLDGDRICAVAVRGMTAGFERFLRLGYRVTEAMRLNIDSMVPQNIDMAKRLEQNPDLPAVRETVELGGIRTLLFIPLRKDGITLGRITAARLELRPFTDKQIALLQSFADQAVIALENARLFNETKEALERQTATAEILKVIANSTTNVQPVFDVIVERAVRLCGARMGRVYRYDGNLIQLVGAYGLSEVARSEADRLFPKPAADDTIVGRVMLSRRPQIIADLNEDEAIPGPSRELGRKIAAAMGARSQVTMPMLLAGEPIGAISVSWAEPRGYNDQQIALLQTFADQAVIAIENARLFNETKEALEQQTATSEVLKVISSSPGELEPVFQALLGNAVHLCEAEFAMLFLPEENEFRAVGTWNLPFAYSEFLGKNKISADPRIPLGRAAITKQPVQVADILVDQSYIERHPGIVAVAEDGGARTLLQVPMLKENELVGTIGIYRQEVRPFSDKQVSLVQNFAAQAVIAIENASLLNELRQRTDDLTRSLNDLRTAQDRLIQTEKLASLGQLTAGIAHEIKNPLNFVNNFSALSAELTDELNDVLEPVVLDRKVRGEVDELTGLLKSNLDKVVQHGKRADSIVKNMLLHSRQGSGEHRPVDINAIVDESLNLAYHGARAENTGFNITMHRSFDPTAGIADGYPQEITRALLNLISNGFYAATKRKADAGDGFEPTLTAATKNLGDKVEIRIRDNGTGIPTEVKEKIFNPFFTTKPAGEGTGLGLSMSHDIIVKQHGGTVDVDTVPGVFTEFKIVLPRAGESLTKSGEHP